ncbi:uncharacterized protein ACNLHF_003867 [Anomaloglossus baeobatrachus]
MSQVDQLEAAKKEQSDQVHEVKKQLQPQLEKGARAADHYKTQMEKAKVHNDVKKQQNQQLSEDLQSVTREQEKLRNKNAELTAVSKRLNKELQRSVQQNKEAEKTCKAPEQPSAEPGDSGGAR